MTEEEFTEKYKNHKMPKELKVLFNMVAERFRIVWSDYEKEFNEILEAYQNYCRVNGLIAPKDENEFFRWIAIRYPEENLPIIIEAAKNPYNYKLFHEYKERLFKNPDWNDEKEMEFLQQDFESPAEPQQSEFSKLIRENFNGFTGDGWQDVFLTEDDFNMLVQILINFFERKPYTIENVSINLKRNTKTKVAAILRDIHKDLSEKQLKKDEEFFKIVRVLNHFKNENDNDLYKALTR